MSATKQQQGLAKDTSLITQMRVNTEWAEQDVSAKAREMFGCEFEQFTIQQAWEMWSRSHH